LFLYLLFYVERQTLLKEDQAGANNKDIDLSPKYSFLSFNGLTGAES
jgi:hypothetical protein